jgi:Domain of unknown function (DUF3784)
MIYGIIGMAILFFSLGYFVTIDNAKYILAGYNTMTDDERKKVDIQAYIPYFKKFHIFLGLSFLIIGVSLIYLMSENVAGIFMGIYPILAYMYFILSARKYTTGISKIWNYVAIWVLIIVLLFLLVLIKLAMDSGKI